MKPRKVSSLTPFAPVLYGDPGASFSVRGRGSVLHRTRPKCETRKKGARCAPDFAAKPPREQSSREGARADARRNAQSSSGGAKRDFASGAEERNGTLRAEEQTQALMQTPCTESAGCCEIRLAAAMVEVRGVEPRSIRPLTAVSTYLADVRFHATRHNGKRGERRAR